MFVNNFTSLLFIIAKFLYEKESGSSNNVFKYQSLKWNAPYDLLGNSVTDMLEYCDFLKSLDVSRISSCNDTIICMYIILVHFSNKISFWTLFISLYLRLWKSRNFHLLLFSTDDPFNEESLLLSCSWVSKVGLFASP